jgi:NitT/TauT family transport system substrate-binding protein
LRTACAVALTLITFAAVAGVAGAPARVIVAFPGPGTLIFIPLEVAVARGFFQDEGIAPEFVYTKGGPPAVAALNAQSVDFIGATIDMALNSYKQGKRIVMVASMTRLPPFAVVTAPSRAQTITSLGGLTGRAVGITNVGAGDQVILRYILTRNGVDPDRVQYVVLGPDPAKVPAVLSGRVDAAIVQEPARTILALRGGRVLVNLLEPAQARSLLGGRYQFTGLLTRPDVIARNPDLVQRMVTAVVRAQRFIVATPGAAIAGVLPDQAVVGNRQLLAQVLDRYKHNLFSPDGRIYPSEVALVVKTQRISGLLDPGAAVDVTAFFTNEFVFRVR